jgi:hypothetical protein
MLRSFPLAFRAFTLKLPHEVQRPSKRGPCDHRALAEDLSCRRCCRGCAAITTRRLCFLLEKRTSNCSSRIQPTQERAIGLPSTVKACCISAAGERDAEIMPKESFGDPLLSSEPSLSAPTASRSCANIDERMHAFLAP